MVPPMVVSIVMSGLADPKPKNYRPESSLRTVRNGTSGAAPRLGDTQQRFCALLGDGPTFGQFWGMTETTSMAALVPCQWVFAKDGERRISGARERGEVAA